MKNVIKVLFTVALVFLLTACGTTTANTNKDDDGNTNGSGGIVAGSVVPSLTQIGTEEDYRFVFELRNDTTEDVKLTMNSSQTFDYYLFDEKGNNVYTYSADKMFTQMLSEKVLKPGETLEMDIDAREGLSQLPAGTYTLEVSSTANEGDYKATTEIIWDGNSVAAGDKLNVQEAIVTFEGLQDSNSIEVTNEQNLPEAMRLNEVSKPFFDGLERGTQIIIYYVEKDGQKIIQEATLK